MKDGNKLLLLLLSACGCDIITCGGAIELPPPYVGIQVCAFAVFFWASPYLFFYVVELTFIFITFLFFVVFIVYFYFRFSAHLCTVK
jgi:hypothetical protein